MLNGLHSDLKRKILAKVVRTSTGSFFKKQGNMHDSGSRERRNVQLRSAQHPSLLS
jgi:hypothetical protein